METLKIVGIYVICIFIICFTFVATGHAETYPRVAVVTDVDYESDIVTFTDSVGFDWIWEGTENWQVGDTAALQLDDQGTDSIFDDIIDKAYYSAFIIIE